MSNTVDCLFALFLYIGLASIIMILLSQDKVTLLGASNLRRYGNKVLLQRNCRMKVLNQKNVKIYVQLAIGGQTIAQLQKRGQRCKSPNFSYKLAKEVVLMIGTNDILRNTKYHIMRTGLLRILTSLKSQEVRKVYLCTLAPILGATETQRAALDQYNNFIRGYTDRRVQVCDINAALGGRRECFETDGIHLNDYGIQVVHSVLPGELLL
ncbi:uncharacterized protein LOC116159113 [Photinus pyralis]|uniref:uncharacterized protein LOC116159113 n=1 Tax=Photinus pyralis TaxID=7054 RepID=UPI0012671365|nr:uncharacterized protein LOC116159113 [Photinus pyralis]